MSDNNLAERLRLINEMSLRCSSAADEREVTAIAAAFLPRMIRCDRAGLSVRSGSADEVEEWCLGLDGAPSRRATRPLSGSLCEAARRAGGAVVLDAREGEADALRGLDAEGLRWVVAVAFEDADGSCCAVHLASRTEGRWDDVDRARLTVVTALLAATLTRIRAHAETLRARRAAEEASRAKSEYLAHLSHEIRTPLNGVIGMISLLHQTALNPEQLEYVNTVRASGEALLIIINDVLDFSKIEAEQVELEDRPFEVRSMLRDALNIVSAQARQRSLSLTDDVDAGVPKFCQGDPFRVQQILVNLLSNAVKFTREGYVRVRVELASPPDAARSLLLRFRVEDSGIGIPADRVDRLFRPFSQADRSTARRFGGTGLGLAISRRLCELMGGSIEVRSAPEQGTVFTFVVRVREADGPDSRAPRPLAALTTSAPPSNLRVLVAEDNPVNQRVAEMMLRKNGFLVDVVSNGREALDALTARTYDVVLMDVQMPELDGLEATRRIVQRYGDARPRIIAMTASAMRGDRELCLEAGMDDYVDKPARASDIVAAIQRVLAPPG